MIRHTSIIVYRVNVKTRVTLDEFMFSTMNCICCPGSEWRCTYQGKEYSMNVFTSKYNIGELVCMVFTKKEMNERILNDFQDKFDYYPLPTDITLINRVEKFYTPVSCINLYDLYEQLDCGDDIDTFFVTTGKKSEKGNNTHRISMDLQCFCAIKVQPFPKESNITIEIFASGVLNVAGVMDNELLARTSDFITNEVLPKMEICSMEQI